MELKTALIAVTLVSIASAYPQKISLGKGEVSASFGGYHASAGLGGVAGDGAGGAQGGLFARAGLSDGTGAAAGLGGVAAGGGAEGGAFAGAHVAGGPKASAGLGGLAVGGGAEGGLHAGAGVGSATGVVSSAGGGGGGIVVTKTKGASGGIGGTVHVVHKPSTLFDDIFNIPTSVLQAVNQFLNRKAVNGGGVRKTAHANFRFRSSGGVRGGAAGNAGGCANTPEGCTITKTLTKNVATTGAKLDADFHLDTRAGCSSPDGCVVVKEKPAATHSEASSSASSSVSAAGNVGVNTNYDNVFNIPIAALKSVNQLLNNLG